MSWCVGGSPRARGGPGGVPLHVQDAVGVPVHHVDQQLGLCKVHPAFLVDVELGRDNRIKVSPPEPSPSVLQGVLVCHHPQCVRLPPPRSSLEGSRLPAHRLC